MITIMGLKNIPEVREGDDIAFLICNTVKNHGMAIENDDIIIVTHKIVSKSEGRLVNISKVTPSNFAKRISQQLKKNPKLVETILNETKRIVKMWRYHLITETKHGFVCPNAGIDSSNILNEKEIALLPQNPDQSARKICNRIKEITGSEIAVIISDTFGRPFRKGQINIAIGVAGMRPIKDYRGKRDYYGRILKVTNIAVADELASAAELVMNKKDNIPVAIVKGYKYSKGNGSGREIIRPSHEDLFH